MTAAHDERRGFVVKGRVQGVGFRWWTQRTATALGIAGNVRNLPGGAVEVHAVGPASRLDDLERVLHVGPSMSSVRSVDVIPPDPRTPTEGFHLELW